MRRGTAFLLILAMLGALLLSGFTGSFDDTEPAAPAESPEPSPEPDRSLSWARAFRSSKLPEGRLTPEEIAFYVPDEEGGASVVNVRKEEVLAWWNEQESLPRTRFFEQFMPENLAELFPVLDYAMAHGYSRASVPTTAFCGQDVVFAAKYLRLTYRINASGIGALSVASFDLEDGQTLQYVLVTLPGMDARGRMSEYIQSIAAAREIVAGIPEGSSEYDKALCLYNWLTENVRYDYDDYYDGQWTLLYDALVKKRTVCAGYAEALYVLYNLAGIECFTIEGYLSTPEGGGGHIWNVAKIDGEYYQFDATWDEGVTPEEYRFFGVSEETLQSYYQRHVETLAEEYCPPCTKDLPLPEDWSSPLFEKLNPGRVRNGVYSQPYFDLTLCPDESWTVYSREEIITTYYMGMDLSMEMMLDMGLPYMDLVMDRRKDLVQIILEPSPVQTGNGEICEDAKSYMDNVALTLPEVLRSTGVKNASVTRYRTEICGRSYEALNLTGKSGWTRVNQTYYCTERDGVFLTISIAASGSGDCDGLLAELLGS